MSRAAIALPILLGVIVVLWGCSPYQTASNTAPDRSLEARVEKLEKELKTAKAQSLALSTDLKAEQGKRAEVERELAAVEKARDSLRQQVDVRTADLAKAQSDLEGVRQGLRDLLGRVDAALPPAPAGATVSSAAR